MQGIGYSARLIAVQGLAAVDEAVATVSLGGMPVGTRLKYAKVKNATSAAVNAFWRWQEALELSREEKKELKVALKAVVKATPRDLDDEDFQAQVDALRKILLLALTREIGFELQQKTQALLDMVAERLQSIERRQQEELDDEAVLLMYAAEVYRLH
jgi:hypothetical protein